MLKRTSIKHLNNILEENKSWKIIDIGCGYTANKNATTIADVKNYSDFYKDKNFVQVDAKKLPFKDNEFDFVIASHVIEHIDDFKFFITELERIARKGYIELPTRLGDNLVYENVKDHIWWFVFDDTNNYLVESKKNQLIEPFITVSMARLFNQIFRESMVLELLWENKIDYKVDVTIQQADFKKISFLNLIRKYFSKKIRQLLS